MTKLILTTMELSGNKCHACAIEEEGQIMELRLETAARQSILGNIYVGKVKNILSNINAAFIEILLLISRLHLFLLHLAYAAIFLFRKQSRLSLPPGKHLAVPCVRVTRFWCR